MTDAISFRINIIPGTEIFEREYIAFVCIDRRRNGEQYIEGSEVILFSANYESKRVEVLKIKANELKF